MAFLLITCDTDDTTILTENIQELQTILNQRKGMNIVLISM